MNEVLQFLSEFIFEPFEGFTIPMREWIEQAVDWFVGNFRPIFRSIAWFVGLVLDGIQDSLLAIPPGAFLLGLFLVAWKAASWRVGLFAVIAFTFVGYIGLWDALIVTLAMVLASVFFCVLIGVPTGIIASRSDRFFTVIRPILDIFQTTPAFVYLVPVVMLFGIGTVPGVIATIIFSMPPIIRLTNLGIRQVQRDAIESALAFGSTPRQVLWKVQFPLALPTIMAGLNQTIMLSLSMVVIAALIGAGGLGFQVFAGLNRLQVGLAGIGGMGIVLLAMALDRMTQGLAEKDPAKRRRKKSK
ncbi:MAG: proline/glycine betaine ABC transporter permease [Candidatus Bipolaricaulota bacterium]